MSLSVDETVIANVKNQHYTDGRITMTWQIGPREHICELGEWKILFIIT